MAGILGWWKALTANFPGTEEWRRRRAEAAVHHAPTYDAWPDLPNPTGIRFLLAGGDFMQRVDLEGYELRHLPLKDPQWRDWFVGQVLEAHYLLLLRMAEHDKQRALAKAPAFRRRRDDP